MHAIHTHNAGIDSYQFNNGFKLILAKYSGIGKAKVQLTVKVGSKHEGYGETGMAHLLEHMLFKNTTTIPDMMAALTELSSEWNGTTSVDRTTYYEVVSSDRVMDALKLEEQRLFHSTFSTENLTTEMTVVRNEMDRADSDPSRVVMKQLMHSAYNDHGYAHATLGATSDVEYAPHYALRAFYEKHYRVDNAFMMVIGDFSTEKVLDYVSNTFGTAPPPKEPLPANWTIELSHLGSTLSNVSLPMKKTMAWLGWRIPPMFTRESVALQLAMQTLGSTERGALRKHLVVDTKQLVELQSMSYDLIDGGMHMFIAEGNSSRNPQELANVLATALYEHIENPPSALELEESRQEELAQYHKYLSDWTLVPYILLDAELQGDWQWGFQRQQWVKEVTTHEMQEALRKWITSNAQHTVLLHDAHVQTPALYKVVNPKTFESYPSIIKDTDPPEESFTSLQKKQHQIVIDEHLTVNVLQRRNLDGYVHIEFDSVPGDDTTRVPHYLVFYYSVLRKFGGNKWNEKVLNNWLNEHNAQLKWRNTGFSLQVLPEHLNTVLPTIFSIWQKPEFTQSEFMSFKEKTLTALQTALYNSSSLAQRWLRSRWNNITKGHCAYPLTIQEEQKALNVWTYEQALSSMQWLSVRSNARLTLVGNVDLMTVDKLGQMISTEYPASTLPATIIQRPDFELDLTVTEPHIIKEGTTPNALVLGALPLRLNAHHKDMPALDLAIHIFGGDTQGRLWSQVRDKEGLAYSVHAGLDTSAHALRSNVSMQSSCSTSKVEHVQRTMQTEWERFIEHGVTQEEVNTAKSKYQKLHDDHIQDDLEYSGVLHHAPLTGKTYTWYAEREELDRHLTLDIVNKAIKKHLSTQSIQWVLATDQDDLLY